MINLDLKYIAQSIWMHCRFSFRHYVVLICFLIAATAKGQTVRLAIVAEDTDTSAAASFLTPEFSKQDHIALLEREQIDKVYREQALTAGGKDFIKIGRVLEADGLLVLESQKEGDTKRLSARLVAVKPGITLALHEYPWPPDNREQWSKLIAEQFQPLLPKLTVSFKDAVPISILDLRSALASIKSEELERELTSLLYARLMKERGIFVLERRRMDLLAEEKQLGDATNNSFWNGSFLIDGLIDKNGIQPDKLTFDLQLTPRDKKGIVSLSVAGPRTNLPILINELAVKIMAAVKVEGTNSKWDTQAEAERYFTEGEWMLKWGLFQEAKSAADAAWVLGKQTRETALLRVNAYKGGAEHLGVGMADVDSQWVSFTQSISTYMAHYGTVGGAANAEQFRDMVQATTIYAEALKQFAGPERKLDSEWFKLGKQVLDDMSSWLRYEYFIVEARAGEEDRIEEAKAACREFVAAIKRHPDFAKLDADHAFLKLEVERAVFWENSPEDTLTFYREIAKNRQWPLVRTRFFSSGPFEVSLGNRTNGMDNYSFQFASAMNPCLVGWTWEERKRVSNLWIRFVEELCGSTEPLTVLEGRILRCSFAWSEADFVTKLSDVLQYSEQQQAVIAAAGLTEVLMKDLNRMLEQRVHQFADDSRERIGKIWPDLDRRAKMTEKTRFLSSETGFEFSAFSKNLLEWDYKPDEAKEIVPWLNSYVMRLNKAISDTNTKGAQGLNNQMVRQQAQSSIETLQQKLKAAMAIGGVGENNPFGMVKFGVTESSPPKQPSIPAATGGKNVLAVKNFWKIPVREEDRENNEGDEKVFSDWINYVPEIQAVCYREGRLWIDVRYDQYGRKERADFIGIDLGTSQAVTIPFKGEGHSMQTELMLPESHTFEVYHNDIYLPLGKSVTKYSFKQHSWEQFPVPTTDRIEVTRLGDRLFFTTPDSILECLPDGTLQVLASSRRRPATTSLDTIDNYQCHLFLTGDKVLHACIQNDVYKFSTVSNDWLRIGSMISSGQVDRDINRDPRNKLHTFEDGYIVAAMQPINQLWGRFGKLSAPEPLFRKQAVRYNPNNGHLDTNEKSSPLLWPIDAPSPTLCVEGDRLWFLAGKPKFIASASRQLEIKESETEPLVLTSFKLGEKNPVTIPLRLTTSNVKLSRAAAQKFPGQPDWFLLRNWLLTPTPHGLVVVRRNVPGFWFIPHADLDRALDAGYHHVQAEGKAQEAGAVSLHNPAANTPAKP